MLEYHHVDVFTGRPYAGNSLAVFLDQQSLTAAQMLAVTQELRHFESIFLTSAPDGVVDARIFDLIEELPFAGHPTIGAAAVLHQVSDMTSDDPRAWRLRLQARTVTVTTSRVDERTVIAELAQGAPENLPESPQPDARELAAAIGLETADLRRDLPCEVVSTGLRYLIVPVGAGALARAHYTRADMDAFLARHGAQFCYLLDVDGMEGRHWNNDGLTEDVATGSAAGCVAAYLLRHGRAANGQQLLLDQGRYVGRPSRMRIAAHGSAEQVEEVTVSGEVSFVGTGRLDVVPAADTGSRS
ncbi:MAG TPA: PhzF family phenazine biosynthesis protein [Jatrophihabitantaceae bacterium]|nr:PhzF family phenazine biosynthesis protein [Jatrophihabitantaceae bacterium]